MLSIIVCSIDLMNFNNLSESIKNTIGKIPYQIIRIDNSVSNMSISKAYNSGIAQAKFSLLLFIHEDVLFHTQNWGGLLIATFDSDPNIGLIGVAGSKIKTRIPSGWWENHQDYLAINIIQHHPNNVVKNRNIGFNGKSIQEVVVLDGVFIAMKLDNRVVFNENINGFHNYDQSISLDYRNFGHKIIVSNEIKIEHFSSGNKNKDWIFSSLKFHKLYNNQLPQNISLTPINEKGISQLYLKFIYSCKNVGENYIAFKFSMKYFLTHPLNRNKIRHMIYFIKKIFFPHNQ